MIRVFIIAASSLARAGVQALFTGRDVEIVGSAANFDSLADHWSDAQPDAILVEASGGQSEAVMDSLAASELASEAIIVVLSDNPEPAWFAEALRAGVRAVLPSDVSPAQLATALETAAAGLVVIHPAAVDSMAPPVAGQVSRGLDSRQAGRRKPHGSRRSRNSPRHRPPLTSPRYFSARFHCLPPPPPGGFSQRVRKRLKTRGLSFW